ncbi:phosphoesterase [Paraburkholderia sp. Ac-20336]|uniref:alkaline phosphatase family protein n=1 Tax=Burkholderiaceae TaxID=119060 RepID=UPI0014240B40|nr:MULTISPECIES: alkaline phosphatase family protein [Burkholderiaceae]MBN3803953.1 phosphoesterase [Paraburkholderia sp. Ac-20336]MBN3846357.1 phosphoesterase [Paraburkholderia sp. Ac-20342]NIF53469.1 phosphoesterase [Burkholderia sp. Ax-1724]NIF76871.1 phosphoesterase [Paraburkholderia sp. Cy-641]
MPVSSTPRTTLLLTSIAAACVLAACGGNDNPSTASNGGGNSPTPTQTTTFSGVVTAAAFKPGNASGNPTIAAGYYAGATVCVDANGNGVCDASETSTTTDSKGHFTLKTSATGQLIADISTKATNTASGAAVPSHLILRASAAQIADQGAANVVISPMSSEVQRLVEANGSSYATEKANLATRLSGPALGASSVTVSATDALGDVNTLSGAEQQALLFEDNQLENRYTYATTKLDRGDMYPDNLAMTGGDPSLIGTSGVIQATAVKSSQTQAKITYAQAQQAAFNVEGVPRYDNVFVIMLENHSVGPTPGTPGIFGSTNAPFINQFLTSNNQFTTYYATGNPSEPNYTALGGADDWGIVDDNWWGCGAGTSGANAPTDAAFAGGTASDGQPLVATTALPPQDTNHLTGLTSAACTTVGSSANHNVAAPNLFTLLSQAGMTWRTYSESMNPGQDPRSDSIAEPTISAAYTGPGANGTAYPMPGALYKTKHSPAMPYQLARNLPEFFADNRTIFGTQYPASALATSKDYSIPTNYNYDQFSTDLANGDVGNLNFIMPDQCDDMHGTGSDPSCSSGSTAIVQRGDDYVRQVVTKIQASPLWTNKKRKVAIVVMFDEGEGSSTSCCGWNPVTSNVNQAPLTFSNGKYSPVTTTLYNQGNHGHGNSVFGVATNQASAGVVDSDEYSHFSFVRTMQDMFQIGDPAQPQTYLARAKYTESFIAANVLNLPELAGSADTHFDSVRPMNHAYITPATYTQKLNPVDVTGTSLASRQAGPDANQTNVWALSK